MKKNFLLIKSILLLSFLGGCTSELDINANPNAPVVTNPDYVLSGAFVATGNIITTASLTRSTSQWSGYAAASGSYSQSGDQVRTYILTANGFLNENPWANLYANVANYNFVENTAKGLKGYDYYVAISKIMKAYCFQNLVDAYGNVPYTDALKGFGQLSPKYDDAQSVYDSAAAQLDKAVSIISNASSTSKALSGSVDLVFKGDMTKWMQLANTLRLRMMIHQSKIYGTRKAYIDGQIAAIVANGKGFLTTNATIQPGYTKGEGQQNPFWETNGFNVANAYAGKDYIRTSNFALNYLNSKSDPRIDYLFRLPSTDPGTGAATAPAWNNAVAYKVGNVVRYNGVAFSCINDIAAGGAAPAPSASEKANWHTYFSTDFGALPTTNLSSAYTSGFGVGILGSPSQDLPFFNAAQSYFLQSEAVLLGWITGDSKALYTLGIKASMTQLGVPSVAQTAYFGTAVSDNDYTTSPINAIITQKWISNYMMDCMEAWTDVRRTGIPVVPKSIDPGVVAIPGGVNANVPIRLLYPQTEYNVNSSNVAAQGTISPFSPKIFWNK